MNLVGAGAIFIGCAVFFFVGTVFIGYVVTIGIIIILVIYYCGDARFIGIIVAYF